MSGCTTAVAGLWDLSWLCGDKLTLSAALVVTMEASKRGLAAAGSNHVCPKISLKPLLCVTCKVEPLQSLLQ